MSLFEPIVSFLIRLISRLTQKYISLNHSRPKIKITMSDSNTRKILNFSENHVQNSKSRIKRKWDPCPFGKTREKTRTGHDQNSKTERWNWQSETGTGLTEVFFTFG